MAAKKKQPVTGDDLPVEEEFEETVPETAPAAQPAKSADRQAREKAKSKKQSGFVTFVKKADPIAMTCFVAIVLAFAVVLGSYIHSEYLSDDASAVAGQNSKVEVEYVGSYISYYDVTGAVIFDTNMADVAGNDMNIFSSNFTPKDDYSYLSFTIGGRDVLKAFGDACVGHQAGDVVRVEIPASDVSGESYGKLPRVEGQPMTVTIDENGTMSLDTFNFLCDTKYTSSDFPATFDTPIEGVDFTAFYDSNSGDINYAFVGVEAKDDAKLTTGASVSISAPAGGSFDITYKAEGNAVLKAIIPDADGNMQAAYFEHISGEDTMTYWLSDFDSRAEMKGETMYFYIVIKSVS